MSHANATLTPITRLRLARMIVDAGWTHAAGAYTVTVGHSSRDLGESLLVELPPSHLPPDWRPSS